MIDKKFPDSISCGQKDEFLLDFLLAANEVETRMSFIYYYQVLEYAAFYYIDSEVKKKLYLILNSPTIHSNSDIHLNKIVDSLTDYRQSDEAKLNKIVENLCDPEIIWREIESNKTIFINPQNFEGGFKLNSLISEDTTFDTFKTMWIPKLPDMLRKIRNSLVHGRESRQEFFISPTTVNDNKLFPWNNLIRRVAEQVVINCK